MQSSTPQGECGWKVVERPRSGRGRGREEGWKEEVREGGTEICGVV